MNVNLYTRKLSGQIGEQLQYSEEQKDVLNYGLIIFIQTMMAIVITVIVGWICGVMKEAITISLAGATLRKTSGGVHATSPMKCIILGVLVSVGGAQVCIVLAKLLPELIGVIAIVIFGWSYIIIYNKAPKDSSAKVIKSEKKKARLRKRSIAILILYVFILVVFSLIDSLSGYAVLRTYSFCLLFGTAWQVFTLTQSGEKLVTLMNLFLIHIETILKRRGKNEEN